MRTVLQAFAQVPGASVFYGPDSYMGANLVEMLEGVLVLPDEEVKRLHPEHTKDTIRDALTRLRFYDEGMCVVHDMFGADVVRTVRDYYADAHLTAHGGKLLVRVAAIDRVARPVERLELDAGAERVRQLLDELIAKLGREIESHLNYLRGNLWAALDLPPGASSSDVTRAYKKLALKYHPDKSDLGVPRCCGAFTPSTRVVSRRGGRGWSLFRF